MAEAEAQPTLHVLIVGAGIGGLTAALGLRQQGHNVDVYEQSRLAQETGAAIHVAPNCNGLLRRLGLAPEDIGGNELRRMKNFDAGGKLTDIRDLTMANKMWQHPWQLVHRAHLHTALKKLATSEEGKGRPVNLHTASHVQSVDPEKASIRLRDGTAIQGDLVIGADGVKSQTRKHIPGGDVRVFDSGKSAFRFLMPTKVLAEDPTTREFVEQPGDMLMWFGEDRRLVMYPCSNNELQNFVAIHPSEESGAHGGADSGWHHSASKSNMINIFKQFGPGVKAVLEKVDEPGINLWTLVDMEKIPTFIHGRFAVLGDAAHPFLPHQAQGGAQAIEDGVSLAALLPLGTTADEIPDRLQLYEKQRYERSHKIQEFTRIAGEDLSGQGSKPQDPRVFMAYNLGHDEWHSSSSALRMHLQSRDSNARFRSPIGFGPSPGPRLPLGSASAHPSIQDLRRSCPERFATRSIKFKTSRTYLESILPPGFAFSSPATVARASVRCSTFDGLTWLGGKGYSYVGLYIHGVHYAKRDGSKAHGTFLAVLFENLTDPIMTGREELGFPKLFADIDIQENDGGCSVQLSWRGAEFGRLEWGALSKEHVVVNGDSAGLGRTSGLPGPPPPPEEGLLIHRYVPAVGEPGKADADYAMLCPLPKLAAGSAQPEKLVAESGSVKFDALDWQRLPTLHQVASGLADMPISGIEETTVIKGTGVEDLSDARRIE